MKFKFLKLNYIYINSFIITFTLIFTEIYFSSFVVQIRLKQIYLLSVIFFFFFKKLLIHKVSSRKIKIIKAYKTSNYLATTSTNIHRKKRIQVKNQDVRSTIDCRRFQPRQDAVNVEKCNKTWNVSNNKGSTTIPSSSLAHKKQRGVDKQAA